MSFDIVAAGGGYTEDDPITFSSDDEDDDVTLGDLRRQVMARNEPNTPNEKYIFKDETSRNRYGNAASFVPKVGDVVVSHDYYAKDDWYTSRYNSFKIHKITDKGTVMVTRPHDDRITKLPIYEQDSRRPVVYQKRIPGASYRSEVGTF